MILKQNKGTVGKDLSCGGFQSKDYILSKVKYLVVEKLSDFGLFSPKFVCREISL